MGARGTARGAGAMVAAFVAIALLAVGCGGAAPRTWRSDGRVCLVLSAGGARGLAHIGAIDAFRERRGRPADCVVGSSMGALIGGLHASDPQLPVRARYEQFAAAYEQATRAEASGRAGRGMLLGGLFALLTGGAGLAVLGAAGVGGLAGAGSTTRLDIDRLQEVLRAETAGVSIEDAPVGFAATYVERDGSRIRARVADSGSLADAVSWSVANPLIFDDVDVRRRTRLDAGADRVAAVPVEDACRLFPGAFLVVVNVTDEPAFYTADMTCPMLEVRVDPGEVPVAAMRGGADMDDVVASGRAAMLTALE